MIVTKEDIPMKTTVLFAIALGLLAPTAATAQTRGYYDDGYNAWRGGWRGDDYREQRRVCTPERALRIAKAQRFPGAKIGRTSAEWIEIRGSHRQTLIFGRAGSCPILGYNR